MRKKNNPEWGASLRRLPWDNDAAATESERLISSTMHEWYDAKHPEVSLDEIALINSSAVKQCPYCGSADFIRCGHYGNGIQRFQCKACNRRFNPLTNTIIEDKKIPIYEWIEYLIHLFEFHSLTTSARDNRNARSIMSNILLNPQTEAHGRQWAAISSRDHILSMMVSVHMEY